MSTGNGSADALLATEHVTKAFGGLVAVEDVSFYVKPRSIVSIIGPNGAGKTTFFNMLTGLYKPTIGRIVFGGTDVTSPSPWRTASAIARGPNPETYSGMRGVNPTKPASGMRWRTGRVPPRNATSASPPSSSSRNSAM